MTIRLAPLALRSASAAVVTVLLTAGGVWLSWLAGGGSLDAVRASGPDAPADLLVVGAAGVSAAVLLWLGLGVTLAALAAVPGSVGRITAAAAEHVAPAVVRRVTAVVVGATLATVAAPMAQAGGSLAAPALSAATSQTPAPPAPDPAFGVTVRPPVADAAPDPSRSTPAAAPDPAFSVASTTISAPVPTTSVPRSAKTAPSPPELGPLGPAPHTAAAGSRPATVTVLRGDSLWVIADRQLGPHATAEQIAREWPRWYAVNRAVIGPNPNLIQAGQVLTVPNAGPS
jgi:nucleoid-associated protein YgaU